MPSSSLPSRSSRSSRLRRSSSSLATLASLAASAGALAIFAPACGSTSSPDTSGRDGGGADFDGGYVPPIGPFNPDGSAPPPGPCSGLQCQIHSCSTGSTTISGTIYDPALKNPL